MGSRISTGVYTTTIQRFAIRGPTRIERRVRPSSLMIASARSRLSSEWPLQIELAEAACRTQQSALGIGTSYRGGGLCSRTNGEATVPLAVPLHGLWNKSIRMNTV